MTNERVFQMRFSKIYPMLEAKAVKKGRSKAEVQAVITWLTGYEPEELDRLLDTDTAYGEFFTNAPRLNPNRVLIKGVVCGVRVETVEDPLMREIRYLDKLIDELAKGQPMERVIRCEKSIPWVCPQCGRTFKKAGQSHYCGKAPETVEEYIQNQPEEYRPFLQQIDDTIRAALPEAKEKISWSMPTYWKGCNLIQFAASKKHIGLYPGSEAVEAFADRLTGYPTSKGTIRLPYDKPLPLELIADIAKWCWKAYAK